MRYDLTGLTPAQIPADDDAANAARTQPYPDNTGRIPPNPEPQPPGPAAPKWRVGDHKTADKFRRQMQQRGWTDAQINEAIAGGTAFTAPNNVNPGNAATRYVHPETGRSVVIDNVTGGEEKGTQLFS